jgi:peptide chain release factor 2
LGGLFDIPNKKKRLKELNILMNEVGFWDNINKSQEILEEYNKLKEVCNLYDNLLSDIDFLNISEDELSSREYTSILKEIEEKINVLEEELYFSGEYDNLNCYLSVHPGAGGTEATDWADMIYNMYKKFCEKNNFTYEVINEQPGEEAGTKSATLKITGLNAYAYLKYETGVHRLVRISPFDSNKRRHTSFASVLVTPEFKDNIDIVINDSDLKIDVYHSSGAGGQSVNTTNSAVRITHLPTKIVVTCQNERSQLKNKEQAMKILKNRIYELELLKNEDKVKSLKGNIKNIDFGSQIRSYVLEPYKLVKDNRSNYESNEPEKILNGEILDMLIFNLKNIL